MSDICELINDLYTHLLVLEMLGTVRWPLRCFVANASASFWSSARTCVRWGFGLRYF